MMSSVDGRLIGNRWSHPFDGKKRDLLFEPYYEKSHNLNADAWMVGRKTIQNDFAIGTFSYEKYTPADELKTFIGKQETKRYCIVIDPKGKLAYEQDTLNGDNIIAILSETVSEEYLSFLRDKGISYVSGGLFGTDIQSAMEVLYNEFEISKILLSGGGILNGEFLKTWLIDELSLLIYPGIDALAGVPSIFEYNGYRNELPAQGQALELLSTETLTDGIVWLRYKLHKI